LETPTVKLAGAGTSPTGQWSLPSASVVASPLHRHGQHIRQAPDYTREAPGSDNLTALERLAYPRHDDDSGSHSFIGGPRLGCGRWQYPLRDFRRHYGKSLAALDVLLREGASVSGFTIATEFGAGSFQVQLHDLPRQRFQVAHSLANTCSITTILSTDKLACQHRPLNITHSIAWNTYIAWWQWWPLLHFVCFRYPDDSFGGELIDRIVKTPTGLAAVNKAHTWSVYDATYKTTPLHLVCMFGGDTTPDHLFSSHNPLACLVRAGADLNAFDACGRTPMELALVCNNGGAVATLLHLGAAMPAVDELIACDHRHHLQWRLPNGTPNAGSDSAASAAASATAAASAAATATLASDPAVVGDDAKASADADAGDGRGVRTWGVDGKIPVTQDMVDLVVKLRAGHGSAPMGAPVTMPTGTSVAMDAGTLVAMAAGDPATPASGEGTFVAAHDKAAHEHAAVTDAHAATLAHVDEVGAHVASSRLIADGLAPHQPWPCIVCADALGQRQALHSKFLFRKAQRAKAGGSSSGSWDDVAEGFAMGNALGSLGGLAAGAALGAI
jgi:hypothetical protein